MAWAGIFCCCLNLSNIQVVLFVAFVNRMSKQFVLNAFELYSYEAIKCVVLKCFEQIL